MSEPRTFGSSQGTLGDSLWLTPLLRAFPGSTLRLFNTPACHNVATLYEGLVKQVRFVKRRPGVPPTTDDATHVSQRMLNAVGKPEASIIPTIVLREDEIAWARQFLAPYGDARRLIVFHTHNSGWADPGNDFARHVKPPKGVMQVLADSYRRDGGYKVLQFCNLPGHMRPGYDNFDPLHDAHYIRGLTLRQTAACYHVVGKMVTGDTGDPYLMLAAGGRVVMLLCAERGGYKHHHVVYTNELWKGEKPRTRYRTFDQWQMVADDMSFDW